MDRKALVSVVIICYNGEQFLAEAIDSVIAQTYNNWELFLVDDGSSDRSVKIMQGYIEHYPEKIRYLEHLGHHNRGLSASRNLGITHAKGEYIALLDCDDVWLPHKLERQVELIERYPEAGMVDGRAYFWYSWTGKPEDIDRDRLEPLPFEPQTLIPPPRPLFLLLEGTSYHSNPSTHFFRREVFDRVGLFNENFSGASEDHDFLAKVFYTLPLVAADEYWTKYRQHSDSIVGKLKSTSEKNKIFLDKRRLYLLKSIQKYLANQEVKYPEIRDYLDRKILRLEKRIWLLDRFIWLSRIYSYVSYLWIQLNERSLSIGRSLLPFTLRNWLWEKVGKRLYYLFD